MVSETIKLKQMQTDERKKTSFLSVVFVACVEYLGPVVQNIVSLTSSKRGQLIKCFMTLLPNTMIFFVKKREKLLPFFQQKIFANLRY